MMGLEVLASSFTPTSKALVRVPMVTGALNALDYLYALDVLDTLAAQQGPYRFKSTIMMLPTNRMTAVATRTIDPTFISFAIF